MKTPFLYSVLLATGFRFWLGRLYRVEIQHPELIPDRGPVIVVANHESMLDPFFLGLATRRPVRYMAKAELWRSPPMRRAMDALGCFPVERGTGDRLAVGRAVHLLEEDQLLGIFPQGTCLPYRDRPWFRGAARLALATGTTVVPICIIGSERALRPGRFKVGLPRIRLIVGEPIAVELVKPSAATARALTSRIEKAIGELRGPYGPPAHAWFPAGTARTAS